MDAKLTARMRYIGQGHELDVPISHEDDAEALSSRFVALHQRRNGFTIAAETEVIGLRHTASGPATSISFMRSATSMWDSAMRIDDGGTFEARLVGPAVVTLRGATLRIARGWIGVPHATGGWLLTRGDQ